MGSSAKVLPKVYNNIHSVQFCFKERAVQIIQDLMTGTTVQNPSEMGIKNIPITNKTVLISILLMKKLFFYFSNNSKDNTNM